MKLCPQKGGREVEGRGVQGGRRTGRGYREESVKTRRDIGS